MRTVPLGEVAKINPRSEKLAPDTQVSFVGMAQLDAVSAQATPLDSRAYSEVSRGYTPFRDGDLLAAKITPCWENGKVGVARLDHPHGVGSTEFHVLRPREGISPRYLLHFLRQAHVRRMGELRMTGSGGQRRVPATFLASLQVPLPPLEEQRRIAAILDQADAVRTKRRQVLAHVDLLVPALFEQWAARCQEMSALEDVATFVRGVTFKPGDKVEPSPDTVAVMRTKNVQRRLDRSDELHISRDLIRREDRFLRVGDTLVSSANSWNLVGKCCFVDELAEPAAIGGFVTALRPTGVPARWLYSWFSSPGVQAAARSFSSQTTNIANLDLKRCLRLPVPIPRPEEQAWFEQNAAEVELRRSQIERATAMDDTLFASLQARAFRGEL